MNKIEYSEVEGDNYVKSVKFLKYDRLKFFGCVILSILTLGFFALLLRWKVNIRV
jgi:hypothetical protein